MASMSLGRYGLTLSRPPEGSRFCHRKAKELRRALEEVVLEERGGVSIVAESIIALACQWTTHAGYAARQLSQTEPNLDPMERVILSREVARAVERRTKAIASLGLGETGEASIMRLVFGGGRANGGQPAPGVLNATSSEPEAAS